MLAMHHADLLPKSKAALQRNDKSEGGGGGEGGQGHGVECCLDLPADFLWSSTPRATCSSGRCP